MTKSELKRFKEHVTIELKGEITEVKLAEGIANYNSSGKMFSVYIENNKVIVTHPMMGDRAIIGFGNPASKVDAMLSAMAFIMVNDRGMTFTYTTRG